MTHLPRLKILRNQLGLSQEKFAAGINLTQQQYQRYEKGKFEPPIEYIKKICRVYNVTADWLLELDEEEKNGGIKMWPCIRVLGGITLLYGAIKHGLPKLLEWLINDYRMMK